MCDHEEAGRTDGTFLTARMTAAEAAVLIGTAAPTGQQGAPHLAASDMSLNIRYAHHIKMAMRTS